jgi:hypothetical protein
VRRVDVPIRLDPDSSDAAVESAWARRLIDVLQRALTERSPDVVHYRHEREALADLVASVAAGRLEHAWAWPGLGLLPTGRPQPGEPGVATILAALQRHQELALAAVVSAVRRAGAPALDRALGVTGWTAVADLVRAAVAPTSTSTPPATLERARPTPAVTRLAATLVRSSAFATAVRTGAGARLRPPAATRTAWAVLVVAEADPALLAPSPAATATLVDAVAELLSPTTIVPLVRAARPAAAVVEIPTGRADAVPRQENAAGRAPTTTGINGTTVEPAGRFGATQPPRPGTAPVAIRSSTHGGRSNSDAAEDSRPADAEEARSYPTIWAGLLFLLAVAEDAGIPATILDDPVLASRPLRWTLHAIARTLIPAAPDDPAVLALAGLAPDSPPPSEQSDPASPSERAGVDELTGRWTAALADRMPEPPEVVAIARRSGCIVADPGWIDVHLRLDEVDVDVRRAGLDLDPGWVPWLGTVVRFRYA